MIPSPQNDPQKNERSSERLFAFSLTAVFFVLVLTGILHHEPWRDELQAWLIARDSVSVPNLLYNLRYEGHPPLWHLVLFLLTRMTSDPFYMQAVHLCIATAAAYIFARFSPFTKLQKGLFLAGYFPLYEYAVKSRCYALGILLFFSFCALFPKRGRHPVLMPLILFLAGLTSLMGILVSAGLWPLLFVEAYRRRKDRPADLMITACFFLLTCVWTFNTVNVPADAYYPYAPFFFGAPLLWRLQYAMNPGHYSGALMLNTGKAISAAIPLFFLLELLLVSLALLRRRAALFAYLAASCALMLFFSIHAISMWHRGHLLLALILPLWLAPYSRETELKSQKLSAASDLAGRALGVWVTLLLAMQIPASAVNLYKDINYRFSGIRDAAEFVKKNSLDDLPIVGDDDALTGGITAYMDRPVYFPRIGKTGSFTIWNRQREREVEPARLLAAAGDISAAHKSGVLLVLSYPLDARYPRVQFLAAFKVYADYTESCYVYYFRPYGTDPAGAQVML